MCVFAVDGGGASYAWHRLKEIIDEIIKILLYKHSGNSKTAKHTNRHTIKQTPYRCQANKEDRQTGKPRADKTGRQNRSIYSETDRQMKCR
jgi:hypothetical protein